VEEKDREIELAPFGMVGLETALGLALTELVEPGHVGLLELLNLMSSNPARILGLAGQGGPVTPGAPANLMVFDPAMSWTVDPGAFQSRSRNTPFAGRELKGRVTHTFFNGRITYRAGRIAEEVPA
jgi:dihydroorotase